MLCLKTRSPVKKVHVVTVSGTVKWNMMIPRFPYADEIKALPMCRRRLSLTRRRPIPSNKEERGLVATELEYIQVDWWEVTTTYLFRGDGHDGRDGCDGRGGPRPGWALRGGRSGIRLHHANITHL